MRARKLRLFAIPLCLLLAVVSFIGVLAPPQTALAAGEKYRWTGANTIEASGGSYVQSVTLKASPNGSRTFKGTAKALLCPNSGTEITLTIDSTVNTRAEVKAEYKNGDLGKPGCSVTSAGNFESPVDVPDPDNKSGTRTGAGSNVSSGGTDAVKADGGSDDVCPINDTSALRWIICPLVDIGDATIGSMQGIIMKFLFTPVDPLFDGIEGSANNFRNVGLSLLAIAALFMIVSQAFGFEIFDAYTIKKVLPRILLAAIGIALCLPLLRFTVTLTNDLGVLVGNIIISSVNPTGDPISLSDQVFGIVGGGPAIAVGSFALAGFSAMGVLALMGTIILAILIGLLVLAIRQMVIMVCILFAPIAIAAYILPGTQKIWGFWKNSLITSLVMFPIIMAFIASGAALSNLLGGIAETNESMAVLALIVRYAPYFMLPFAFKLAGGLMSTIFSIANDRGKGLFDRSKNFRAGQRQQNLEKMRGGSYLSDRNRLSQRFNRASAVLGSGPANWTTAERRNQAVDQATRGYAANNIAKDPRWQGIMENDDAVRALTYQSAAQARNAGVSPEAIAAAQASVGFGRGQAVAAAQQLANTGTGYNDVQDQVETIARASGGDKNTAASIAGYNNFINKQKGRHDLAPGFGDLNKAVGEQIDYDSGRLIGPARGSAGLVEKGWSSGSLYQIANGKPKATEQFAAHWQQELITANNAVSAADAAGRPATEQEQARLHKAAAAIQEFKAMQPNASGENSNIINRLFANQDVQDIMNNPSLSEASRKQARVYERPDPNNIT